LRLLLGISHIQEIEKSMPVCEDTGFRIAQE
jgi:hypothetical protein